MIVKLTGFSGTQYSHEYTVIDPQQRTMSLTTRNLNGSSFLRVDEKLTYTPLPEDPSKTILKQEAIVTITLPAFVDYCEKAFIGVYSTNAAKGRKGVEWVIDQLKNEYTDISTKVSAEVQGMQEKVKNAFIGANQPTSSLSP
ncbi:PRELI-like family protein [Oesophagostomum dentatum]|uniref:PRELI-like family protein n=1 Tax=Oesophagostomum dentatum TaxID=61180 RepID=A0A0B1T4B2_OESDE|nr:PRELI-like family protein [Oesophagostomum dentatum]